MGRYVKSHRGPVAGSFHRYGEEANRDDPDAGQAVLEKNASCFHYAGRYAIDELTHEVPRSRLHLRAMRRPRGQIGLLVAGLTGPATYAAAQGVNRMSGGLDDWKPGRASAAYWQLVRARVTKVGARKRETYEAGEVEFVTGDVWE